MLKKYSILFILVLLIFTFSFGCQGKDSYKVLSFFFDGVPLPDEKKSEETGDKSTADAQPETIYREHGPYASRQCDGCHIMGSNRLVIPVEELCFRCHTMNISEKYVHGPLASGGCIVCHEPHGSRYPFLLVAESQTFCLHCHWENDILKAEVHRGREGQCTICHDAHSSDNAYLLK